MRNEPITEELSRELYQSWVAGYSITGIAEIHSLDRAAVARTLEKEMARRRLQKTANRTAHECRAK